MKALHPDAIFNRFSNIRKKIFSLTFLLLIIFGLIGLLTFQIVSLMYEEAMYQESAQSLDLSSHVLDEELRRIENLSFQISTENFTQTRMSYLKDNNFSFEAYRMQAELIDRMTVFANQESYISSVILIEPNGRALEVWRAQEETIINLEEKLQEVEEGNGGNVWLSSEDNKVLLAAREIKQKEELSMQHLGYLIIVVNLDDFINRTLDFSSSSDFIITKNEEVIYKDQFETEEVENVLRSNTAEDYSITQLEEEEYFITNRPSQYSDIVYYNIVPFENIAGAKKVITRLMAGYFVFILFFTVFLSRKSAYAISRPIEQLTEKMKQVQNGNFSPVVDKEGPYLKDEIGDLQHNFSIMLDKINQLIKENYTKQLLIKETEYKALQSQINPHFLYNTLDSINWIAKVNDQEKISAMVEALGNMMRNIISKKAPLITLKEEMDIVTDYITIQKYRYGDRLHFHLDYDSSCETARIPKLTIQPLVENAIQHGLEEMATECYISVHIFSERGFVNMIVQDNGPGMNEETITQIYQGQIKPKGSGIGLYNIMERINIMFGEESKVVIESRKNSGTDVKISLPFMEDEM